MQPQTYVLLYMKHYDNTTCYCKEICSRVTGECVTLMLMAQTVNSCKVAKDQTDPLWKQQAFQLCS
jgi:hypothetical protein